ncbi:CheR family methyltransferase [Actinoplanes sp. TBRC 11911]|uniref:CheR family methyltransferase n=1 Tax=Actinoplanes sp. TBRC 11911 TaxID=2729386 RepID=UPI00289F00F6|nr:CheR family methyltransferase [Actinoplanes sp. TBRC 11911]
MGSRGRGGRAVTEAGVSRFREVLGKSLGWSFADADAAALAALIGERAALHGMSGADYVIRLAAREWPAETSYLVERLSITETYFFRHGEQFRALAEQALPERVADRGTQRLLRMLSVACSSGEEAYTLAMVARQECAGPDWIVDVLGVDANPAVLRKAEEAWYSSWSLRETPDAAQRRWFRVGDGGYRVRDEVRRCVRFRRYNVTDADESLWRPAQYDVIFCRNLLMYLTPDVASSLVARMTEALVPGGYLFLGHTDSLGSAPAGLELLHTHHSFYYRRPGGRSPGPRPAPPATAPACTEEDAYNRAISLLREEQFAEALELITAGLPGRPRERDRLLEGVLLAQAGRLTEAMALARRLIDGNGLYADAHQLLGLCLEDVSDTDEAIGQYRLAAFLDTGFALPRLRLGQLARRRGDDRAAAGDLERALDLLPHEDEERIALFGGGFGRISLTVLCRSELDGCEVRR